MSTALSGSRVFPASSYRLAPSEKTSALSSVRLSSFSTSRATYLHTAHTGSQMHLLQSSGSDAQNDCVQRGTWLMFSE